MENKKRNKPKRRFAGFADDWEERKVREVTDRYDNLRVPVVANLRVPGSVPYYGANGVQDYVDGYTHNGEFVLVAEDGANDLKNYPVMCVKGRIWVNNHAHVLQGKKKITDNKFLSYVISQADIESLLVGGSRAKLNAETLMDIELLLPTKIEQAQIGGFLTHLDHLITLHQRKLDKLDSIKKSYLSEMFPQEGEKKPKRRFKGFTDDWEQRKLGEVCSEIGDGLHSAPIYDEHGDYYFINGNNLVNGKIEINPEETKRVSRKIFDKNDKHLDDTTVLFSINGTIGNLAYYKGERVMLGKSTAYFKAKNIDKTFLFVLLQTSYVMNNFMVSLTGTTIKNLGLESIKSTKIMMPRNEEQKSIGLYFQQIDHLITLHQRKLEKLKNIKQAYLNEMFV